MLNVKVKSIDRVLLEGTGELRLVGYTLRLFQEDLSSRQKGLFTGICWYQWLVIIIALRCDVIISGNLG